MRAVGEERLAEVEDDVGLERVDPLEDDLHVVVDGERLDLVPELAQAREHVGLGGLLLLGAQRLHAERLVRPTGRCTSKRTRMRILRPTS